MFILTTRTNQGRTPHGPPPSRIHQPRQAAARRKIKRDQKNSAERCNPDRGKKSLQPCNPDPNPSHQPKRKKTQGEKSVYSPGLSLNITISAK